MTEKARPFVWLGGEKKQAESGMDLAPLATNLQPGFMSGADKVKIEGIGVLEVTAGEAVGGQKVVYASAGEVFLADSSVGSHVGKSIGVTEHAASLGELVKVRFSGEMTDGAWAFADGPVYVGAAGALTQTKPSTGWVMNIAVAISATKILIKPLSSIERG